MVSRPRLPWRIRRHVLKLTGRSGYFKESEYSRRAHRMDRLWDSHWPQATPHGYLLRDRFADRWVRFHSLPEAKRYADDATESGEIIRRQRIVLEELRDRGPAGPLVVIAEDWDWDGAGGWSKLALRDAWPWRSAREPKARPRDEESALTYFWVAEYETIEELETLLHAVAEEEAHLTIADYTGDWLFHPYDGGVDVITKTTEARDRLRAKYSAWASIRPDGL